MTHLNTVAFKAALLLQRQALQAQLTTLRGGEVGRAEASSEHFTDREDRTAQANSARDLELALDAHDTAEISLVNAALKRIEDGSYGECLDCGTHIAEARLKAAPEANRCIHCQEKLEKSQRA
jgi:DnaK suppressor protein